MHTYPANSLANPELFEYALQSGYFFIRLFGPIVITVVLFGTNATLFCAIGLSPRVVTT